METGMAPPWEKKRALREKRFIIFLVVLALSSRLIWTLWLHPPEDYLFSDMAGYFNRASRLLEKGLESNIRGLAFQAWGTHYLLALFLKIGGIKCAAAMWGLMGALSVVVTYLLATRLFLFPKYSARGALLARICGGLALIWVPHFSNNGFFLSETPFTCFQLIATWSLVRMMQTGRGAWLANIALVLSFALRPQFALFCVCAALLWFVFRRRYPKVRSAQVVSIAVLLALTLGFSAWRFHRHTGSWRGIAENANMNLTAGRCHNIYTEAFKTQKDLRRIKRKGKRKARWVGLPGYRILNNKMKGRNDFLGKAFALKPALGNNKLRYVGGIGDKETHRALRQRCYAATGGAEQLRYSMVNVSLLWFFAPQWPELSERKKHPTMAATSKFYGEVYPWIIWWPSMLGLGWALLSMRRNLPRALLAIHLLLSIVIASIFFGTIRLRSPYDPYAIILALLVWNRIWNYLWSRFQKFSKNRFKAFDR